jgi:hypothetical protein
MLASDRVGNVSVAGNAHHPFSDGDEARDVAALVFEPDLSTVALISIAPLGRGVVDALQPALGPRRTGLSQKAITARERQPRVGSDGIDGERVDPRARHRGLTLETGCE